MKKNTFSLIILASALVGGIFSTSCNKGKTNTTQKSVTLVNGNLSFDIPIMPVNGEYDSIVKFNFKINADSFVKSFNADYDTSSIRSVLLNSCVLTLPNGSTVDNFRNFHTANIGVSSGTYGKITRIATFMDIVDTAAYSLNIPRWYDQNLATYFKSDSICYHFYGNVRKASTAVLNCKAVLSYEMVLSK